MTEAGQEARERGRRGGVRSGQVRRRLVLEEVERELGALDTVEDVSRWLHRVGLWGAAGLVPGVVLGGLVRTCEIKLRVLEHEVTAEITGQLRRRLEELERQLKQQREAR